MHMRRLALTLILASGVLANLSQAENSPAKVSLQLPPSAELLYSIRAKQSGIPISGSATVKWQLNNQRYQISTETRAMLFGKILDISSEGKIDDYGLAPDKFYEKRFGKAATTSNFERDSKTLKFTASPETYPLKGGEQDRSSATWQLIGLARTMGDQFKTGSEWKMFVAGRRDAETWTFKVVGNETINTALGSLNTVHVSKAPPADSKGQQVDIWLAPSIEWYPVRIRFNDSDGEFVDQMLEEVKKTGAN
jgi:hypothetical protein